jgi:flavin reductase (DIM6/NTAB) family NADH-FMN oxidoreductase RutF
MMVKITNFKKALSNFASGVSIITVKDNDAYYGVTISSLTSLSLEPSMVLFCLGKNSNHAKFFIDNKYVAINILNENQQLLSEKFSQKNINPWIEVKYSIGNLSNCPLIEGCITHIEGVIVKCYDGGDHNILLVEVKNIGKISSELPLIHFRSNYLTIK